MRIRYAEIYSNTEILSPIDPETWQRIGDICKLTPTSRVLELASGKGAYAFFTAQKFGCKLDCFDRDEEFVEYSSKRAEDLQLSSQLKFTHSRVEDIQIEPEIYDLGVCLGSLYIFREAGMRTLLAGVKPIGYLAISDLYCKKIPPTDEVREVFFEEEGEPISLDEIRGRYNKQGLKVLREVECSRKAWLNYYDLTKAMLQDLARRYPTDTGVQSEIGQALEEDWLVRKFGEEYLGYMTFIMQKQ